MQFERFYSVIDLFGGFASQQFSQELAALLFAQFFEDGEVLNEHVVLLLVPHVLLSDEVFLQLVPRVLKRLVLFFPVKGLGYFVIFLLPSSQALAHVCITTEYFVLLLPGGEMEETFDAEHAVLGQGVEELADYLADQGLQFVQVGVHLLFLLGDGAVEVEVLHEAVVGVAFVQQLLEHDQVLQLEEYPGRVQLVGDPLEQGSQRWQQGRVLLVLQVLDDQEVLADDLVVDIGRYFPQEVELPFHQFVLGFVVGVD